MMRAFRLALVAMSLSVVAAQAWLIEKMSANPAAMSARLSDIGNLRANSAASAADPSVGSLRRPLRFLAARSPQTWGKSAIGPGE